MLAQMILGSSMCLVNFSEPLLANVGVLMKEVSHHDPIEVRAYEIKEGLVWGTFLPYMEYLYHPTVADFTGHAAHLALMVDELQLLSVKVLLYALYNALGRENHVKILVNEGLLDFVVILPWYLPSCSEVARSMIKDIGKWTRIEPPSLSSLAKARLARDTTGLKKVMTMRSMSDLFQ